MPLVTVLIPAFNARRFLRDAIESIERQSFKDWELLVIDDGSIDDTYEIACSYSSDRIRTIRNPNNLKLIRTLNIGLQEAAGKYIARLDADDIALPNRLASQIEILESRPDIVMIGGRADTIDENRTLLDRGARRFLPSTPQAVRTGMMFMNPFGHSSITYRRQAAIDAGGYPLEYKDVEDYEMWRRLLAYGGGMNLTTTVCARRRHTGSVTNRLLAESAVVREDPRRPLVERILRNSCEMSNIPSTLGEQWAALWKCMAIPIAGEKRPIDKISGCLREICRHVKTNCNPDRDSQRVLSWAWGELTKHAIRSRSVSTAASIQFMKLRLLTGT
jgi:glycosyltransferase involved in cell wall biosynthesis